MNRLFLALVLSPLAVGDASASPSDSLRCQFHDFATEPPGARAAGKRLATLDAGEPRTVRLFYFLPSDRRLRVHVVQRIRDEMLRVQAFIGEQMEAHGFGYRTFRLETDDEGDPVVHRVNGQHPDSHYIDGTWALVGEIGQRFDLSKGISVLVIDNSNSRINRRNAGEASRWSKESGAALVSGEFTWTLLAHELIHTFGMGHDFRDDRYIMSFGQRARNALSACSAGVMAVHPYFNPDVGLEWGEGPAIERLSPVTYPEGSTSVPIRLRLADPDGLHQVRLRVPTRRTYAIHLLGYELKVCRGLAGEEEALVEIDYDGVIPSGSAYGLSNLSNPQVHPINLSVLDADGNRSSLNFDLWQLSRQHLATLEMDNEIHAVTFAPAGATLASASAGGTGLWDVQAGMGRTASLSGGATAAALSPDGATLAYGSGGRVRLLDLESRRTTSLSGPGQEVRALAFSSDGTMLASAVADGIRLWDVEAGTRTAALPAGAASVAFSRDGATLASGSRDGIRLWNLETGTEVAAYRPDGTGPGGGVKAVAFSPDGTLIASAWGDSTVGLWDLAESVAVLEGHDGPVRSVAFSADGTLLASGADLAVCLWDPATKGRLATLQGEGRGVNTVAFSPDGAALAAGTEDGRIGLWDIAEWRVPRPRRLVMVSGDGQQGAGGEVLADPLVVEVRDQYDAPLPGVEVTFAVTQGDGRVGGRFTLESRTTDDRGRVEAMLTLGPLQGANIVEVASPGLQGFPFSAAAVGGLAPPRMEGDFHTWRLPHAATFRLGKGGIRSFVLSPDGEVLAVGTDAGIWLYDAATRRELALLPARPAVNMAYSPDGTILASCGSYKDRVRLWDVETGHQMVDIDVTAQTVAFSPDGKRLATASTGIELWDVETGIVRAAISEAGLWGIRSVAFSPDGRTLAAGSADHTVRLWDVETAAGTEIFRGHGAEVQDVSFSPDGRTLASASADHTIRLWEVATGAVTTLQGHDSWVVSLDFTPDGSILVSGSDDIRLWDLATGQASTIEGGGGSLALASDGRTLASRLWGSSGIALWDLASRSAVTMAEGHIGGMSRAVALSPDGRTLATGLGFDKVQLWDLETATGTAVLQGHTSRLNAVAFSPDGTILASASSDRTVKLWNVATGAEITTLEALHGTWISALAYSPDGGSIASGDARGGVKLWDVASGQSTATYQGDPVKGIGSLAFSPDGTTLAAGSAGLDLWDLATDTSILTEKFQDAVYAVSFTPDGTALALARRDFETLSIWKVPPGRDRAALSIEYPAYAYTAAFSPDGSIVASGTLVIGNVDMLEVRDVATGALIASLEGHGGTIGSLAFSPDGSTFASGSEDGTALVWDLARVLRQPRTATALSGDGQEGGPEAVLSEPFVIEVRDQNGDPLEGVRVLFRIVGGGGSLSVETSETDARGRAATTLTLGSAPGRNTVLAIVSDLEAVTFSALTRSAPTTLDKVGGDEQQGSSGSPLAAPLVVSLLDQEGSPMAGVAVTFAVTAGGGTLSATAATTDSQGRAATILTLGRTPGPNTVEVTVAGLAPVTFTAAGIAVPRTLAKISGDGQLAAGGELAEPFVVSVLDQNGEALPGAVVTFAVTAAGDGTLSAAADTTDAGGLASTTLTLGEELGPVTVEAAVEGLEPVAFTATRVPAPDFDGDGEVGFADFLLFSEHFGGTDPRFDLDASGSVDFADFFLLAEHFGQPARARLVALAQRLIGLPEGPGLQQNAPNPFNSQTVISWFLLEAGPARLEVFAMTGQRVAGLHDGPLEAGLHRLRWDGRDDQGRPLASGVYVYRLVTAGGAQTRKLTLLR